MNATDPSLSPEGELDPTHGLPWRTAAAINILWEQDGPPPEGPVRLWEPEHVLSACGRVQRDDINRLRGRSATAAVQRLLGTVIGFARVLHPPIGWTLETAQDAAVAMGAPVLLWRHETTGTMVGDVLRAPVQCAPLLDDAAAQTVAALATTGAAMVRVVDLRAPRRTRALTGGRADVRFDQRPDRIWAALNPAAATATARMVVA